MESPLQIRYSLGIQRGKTDLLDAQRIAKYAYTNRAFLRFWEPEREVIKDLRLLRSLRSRLLAAKVILASDAKLQEAFLPKAKYQILQKLSANGLQQLKKDIVNVENRILSLIQSDVHLNHLFEIITSIPYVGRVIATEVLIVTNEFKNITTAKKFASYAGIAPFKFESGSSIKKPTRISWIGDKRMKTLIHVAAVGYIRKKNSFLGRYYTRKVAEGKNKMSVLNAIRNKLVQRIYSCVMAGKKFTDIEE